MTFFDDISAKFKLIPDVIGQTVKTIQSQAQNQQVQKQVKQMLPAAKPVEQPAPQPTFFKDVAEKFNVLPQYQLEKQPIIKTATSLGQEIKQKVGQPLVETVSKIPGLETLNATPQQKAVTQEKYKEYSFSDLGKDVTNLGLNFTVNPLLRIGMTIKGQNDVGPGLGFKDAKTYQQETIGSYPAIYGQYRKEGSNPVIAGLRTGITAAFDATLGYGLAKEFLPAARLAVRKLPDTVLYKIQESKIPVDDIIGSISGAGGTKGTKEADAFVSSLDNKERVSLYRTAQAYSKSGIPAVSKITKEPTALGEFAGLNETNGIIKTNPAEALPGQREVPGQAPAMGLSIRKVGNVGYGDQQKAGDILSKHGIDKEIGKTEDDYIKGDVVSYNGENYKFIKNYGVNGDKRLIEDSYGRQTPVLPEQIKKVSDAEGVSAYGMSHRPTETGATADDISKGDIIPSDFYDHPEWYANMRDKNYKESFSVLESIKGNPDAEITIYRASPKKELNNGDWITLSKGYAKQESLSENTPVHSFKVRARDIQFAGDDINEFGYYPKENNETQKNKDSVTEEKEIKDINPSNFKSAEDYIKAQNLYHGTSAELQGGKLSFGKGEIKKGGQSGGLFLSDTPESAQTFGKTVYQASPEIKNSVIDLTKPEGIKQIENYIGKTYKTFDGETVKFTRQDFESMFPLGKTDFASISQFPELVDKVVTDSGKRGIAFDEYAGGKMGKTYQILNGDIPVKTKSQLIEEWNKVQEKPKKLSLKPARENQKELDEITQEIAGLKQTLSDDPARHLSKYANKHGELGEVLGLTQNDIFNGVRRGIWGTKGDQYISEIFGEHSDIKTSEDARKAWDNHYSMKQELPRLEQIKAQLKSDHTLTYSEEQINEINRILTKSAEYDQSLDPAHKRNKVMIKALTVKEPEKVLVKSENSLLKLRIKSEARGAKMGAKSTRLTIRIRRNEIKSIAERYGLSNNDLNRIIKNKNLSTMNSAEFADFKKYVDEQGQKAEERRIAANELGYTIQHKDLKKVENYQKALELPNINKMTTEELRKFNDLLQPFEEGDVFLSPRKLEMIDRTDLSGVKTIREARIKLAEKLGVSPNELAKINVGEFDRFKWDTSLAETNPFYKTMVEGFNSAILEGDARFLEIQKKADELISKARKGKGLFKMIGTKIAPTDNKIFDYLESTDKAEAAKGMTPAELEAAEFMRSELNKALEYEYEMQVLKKSGYEDSYITHIRRGFFEALKEGEIKKAFTELFDQYKQDEAVLTIMDQKTDQIIPLEKFFKFAMHRSGNIAPTKNVAKAFTTYMRIFERKKALDKIIPEVMTYVDVLTPQEMTSRGLVKDDKLKSFVTEYLNTKKGRAARMFVKPGGKADVVLRAVKGFTTLLDLSLNIPVQLGSQGGVHMGLYTVMGTKRYATGVARLTTPRGRNFVKKYENYTGRTPWAELHEASKGLPEKAYETMFALFKDATVRGNKIHILGSLTPEEWSNGKVSTARLAEMKTELGRFLPVEGSKSILGSTTEGGMATQYKTWAIPVLITTTKDLGELAKMLKNRENPLKSREFWELFRLAVGGSFVALVAYSVGNEASLSQQSQAGKSFPERVTNKLVNDSFSMVSAIDPQTYTSVPRTLTFVTNLMTALSDLVRMNEYKTAGKGYEAGDLKGVKKIENLITPVMIKNILPTKASKTSNPAADILKKYKADTTSTKADDILKKYNL